QVLPGLPTVVLDVAHNPHAAAHLANNLDAMESAGRSFAVFGVMRDKDVDGIVGALKDRFERWFVTDLPGERAAKGSWIAERLRAAGVDATGEGDATGDAFSRIEQHATPSAALAAARAAARPNDRIVVFGSFLTVADILSTRASSPDPSL